jgi:tetratricopeptide (TPR) repeat protein
MPDRRYRVVTAIAVGTGFLALSACAYFNTFYNAQSYYQQGRKLVTSDTLKVDSDMFDKAIEKSVSVIVKYPGSQWVDDALFIMGASYYYKGDYNRALEKLDVLIATYPETRNYNNALYFRALCQYKQGRYSPAIIQLRDLIPVRGFRKRAEIALCYVYYRQQDYQSLSAICAELIRASLSAREKQQVLSLLGEAQFNLKQYDAALATYNQLLAATIKPDEKRKLKLKIGKTYLATERYEESKNFLSGEEDPEFKVLLAEMYYKLNDIQESRQTYRDVVAAGQYEYLSQAYYQLGELWELEDSVDAAIAYYDTSAMKSGDAFSQKAKKKADILKRVRSLKTDTLNVARAEFLLAEVYFTEFKDLPKALAGYEHVYAKFPGSEWAPKAMYARFWITRMVLKDDSLARPLAEELNLKYPNSEYALSAGRIMRGEVGFPADSLAPADTVLFPADSITPFEKTILPEELPMPVDTLIFPEPEKSPDTLDRIPEEKKGE